MAVVIGAATLVDFRGSCVISVNWGYNPAAQRLYCLGEKTPRYTINRPTETLSITIYSGESSDSYSTLPTETCASPDPIFASVSPGACPGTIGTFAGDFHVNSYSFNKDDATMPGQETWGLTRWVAGVGAVLPTYIFRGFSEGQASDQNGSITGINFDSDQTLSESSTGSVSAGAIGRADILYAGVVASITGGSSAAGETGQGSVSIPYTPVYI